MKLLFIVATDEEFCNISKAIGFYLEQHNTENIVVKIIKVGIGQNNVFKNILCNIERYNLNINDYDTIVSIGSCGLIKTVLSKQTFINDEVIDYGFGLSEQFKYNECNIKQKHNAEVVLCTCNDFVTDKSNIEHNISELYTKAHTILVDMEAYAVKTIAEIYGKQFLYAKFVSDNCNTNEYELNINNTDLYLKLIEDLMFFIN